MFKVVKDLMCSADLYDLRHEGHNLYEERNIPIPMCVQWFMKLSFVILLLESQLNVYGVKNIGS